MSDQTSPTPTSPARRRLKPRVIGMLVGLLAVICGSVIVTDHLARNSGPRRPHATTTSEKGNPR
jgi:hypothetical protein